MTRRESREQAFLLTFEKSFSETPVEELALTACEARDAQQDPFTLQLAVGTEENRIAIDEKITAHSHNWAKDRISRVALAVLRLALFEMLYVDDIPVSVSINEAVELAKKYGGEEDSSFVNGVLGSIAREGDAKGTDQ